MPGWRASWRGTRRRESRALAANHRPLSCRARARPGDTRRVPPGSRRERPRAPSRGRDPSQQPRTQRAAARRAGLGHRRRSDSRRRSRIAGGQADRDVPGARGDRPRRHGHRLRRGGRAAPAHGGAQGPDARIHERPAAPRAADPGGARSRGAVAPRHRDHFRPGRDRRRSLHRLRARARPHAARGTARRTAAAGTADADPPRDHRGARRGPRSGHRPPRSEAGEHHQERRGADQGPGLRARAHGVAAQRADVHPAHRSRSRARHARLHGAGTAQRRRGRRAIRRVRIRRARVGARHRRTSVRHGRRVTAGTHDGAHGRTIRRAVAPAPAAGSRPHRAAVHARAAGRALSLERRAARGPAGAP